MYYYFDDKINSETINELVEKLQVEEGHVNLWFSTAGGCLSSIKFLIEYLNTIHERVTITFTNRCWSAGTYLLVLFKGKIILHKDLDSCLFHAADMELYTVRKDDYPFSIDEYYKQTKKHQKDFAKKIKKKGLLTDKQLEKYLKGKDVLIYQKQFRKWKI